MNKQKGTIFALLVTSLFIITTLVYAQEEKQSEREKLYFQYATMWLDSYAREKLANYYVKGGVVEPHWMTDGNSFWYAEGAPENTIIYKVDPRANTKEPLFDTCCLRKALAAVLGHEPSIKGIPFKIFTFVNDEKAVKFKIEEGEFILQLGNYNITQAPTVSVSAKDQWGPKGRELLSPDGQLVATIKEHNLWLRSTSDGSEVQITKDGIKDYEWDLYVAQWSPDSLRLALVKYDFRVAPKMPIVRWLKTPEDVEWIPYDRPGFPICKEELFIIEIPSRKRLRIDTGELNRYLMPLEWSSDGAELFYRRMDRWVKRYDLMGADSSTGSSRIIHTEVTKTFFYTAPFTWVGKVTFLSDGKRFIYASEEDGWAHLYLYDFEGNLIRQLTKGALEVTRLVTVDEATGWIYFAARVEGYRPYDDHLFRVNLEGQGFKRLTEAPADHDSAGIWRDVRPQMIQFSPSKEFFLDTYSTVNQPPVVELRRADGTLLQVLSRANIDVLLEELKWIPPEEFVVKAADGETDLHGALYKPYNFDLDKKCPVIEMIDDAANVPHTFTSNWPGWLAHALAQQGFIVFLVNARGTEGRGKEFRDVFFRNEFVGYSIVDHVATIKQLAERRPYIDLDRVGVYGYSGGGTLPILAMLQAPEVYHVGISGAPYMVDPYRAGAEWIEPYLGLPQDNPEGYEKASLHKLAGNLKGHLLLIHGTSDDACPFSHTMKMVDALIRANKPFDLLVFPEGTHMGVFQEPYYLDAVRRYFVEHLKPEMGR